MLFSSSIFVFAFLPVVLAGAALLGKARHTVFLHLWLFAASLFFYGWWNWRFLPLLLALIVVNYTVGLRLIDNRSKKLLCAGISANLFLLFFFKYTGFLVLNLNGLFGAQFSVFDIAQPLALSFLVFQQISFLTDCCAGKIPVRPDLLKFCLFTAFFAKIAQGPIVRYNELMPRLERRNPIHADMLAAAFSLFTIGLFKKVFLADTLGDYASPLFDAAVERPLAAIEAWTAMLSYTFQIYFDFSGYSDMAAGVALMFGLKLPLNFFSPYKAVNIIDFWRRWHMTLSRFLRDYLYIPLGGNRKGKLRRCINLLVTMLLGGLWHGASWNFVIWGGLHGSYLVINHFFKNKLPDFLSRPLTFIAVAVAWIFFRAADAKTAVSMLNALVTPENTDIYRAFFTGASPLRQSFDTQTANLILPLLMICAAVCFLMPNASEIMRRGKPYTGGRHGITRKKSSLIWQTGLKWGILTGVVLGFCLLKVLYEPSSVFLYFKF